MITDALLAVSGSITGNTITPQSIFASGATVVSTNTIDLGVARDMFEGDDHLFARGEIVAAVTGGTSVEIQIITSASANLGTPTVIGTSGAIPVATLVAGYRFAIQGNPKLASTGQRYLGLQYVNVGANTTGTAYADFGAELQDGQKFYGSGFAVL